MKLVFLVLIIAYDLQAEDNPKTKIPKPVDCKKVEVQLRAAGKKCLSIKATNLRASCMNEEANKNQGNMAMCGDLGMRVKADLVEEEKKLYPNQGSTLDPIHAKPKVKSPPKK